MFISIILIIVNLIIVPFLLGLLCENLFTEAKEKVVFSRVFAFGLAGMLAIFQLIAVPVIIVGTSFKTLVYIYMAIIAALAALSIYLNYKTLASRIKASFAGYKSSLMSIDKEYLIVGIVAILLIVLQTSLLILRVHTDTDDSRFIAEALEAIENNTLLRVHPITGESLSVPIGEMRKDVTSPYPIFIAVMSAVTLVKPAVLSHFVFPILLIPLCYLVVYLIGTHIFEDVSKRLVYLFISALIILFSFESVYSWGYTLLAIIWQGRSISAVIMLPLLWYVLMKIYTEEKPYVGYYFAVVMIGLANADLSGMGALMGPLIGGGFAASYLIKNKKLLTAIYIGLAVVPCGIYALIKAYVLGRIF